MGLKIRPCTITQANELIERFHRHHKKVVGHRFSLSAWSGGMLVGVAVVGRPVGREISQYEVAEVTRLCTDGTKNACSILYARCAKIVELMGFMAIQTYILAEEPGTSLIAVGWENEGIIRKDGSGWNNRMGRREDQPQTAKQRWRKYFCREYRETERQKLKSYSGSEDK